MFGFDGVQRGNYFGLEPIRRTEMEAKVRKHKNGEDVFIGEMIKGGGDMVAKGVLQWFGHMERMSAKRMYPG